MVVNKKAAGKAKMMEKKPKNEPIDEIPINDDSDVSNDDMSEEELQKMLGTSDNSDVDSEEFSEEEAPLSVEAKANKKRRMESDEEEENENLVKRKKVENDDGEDVDNDDDDDEDDEDEDEDDGEFDSFIVDDEEGDDDEEEDDEEEKKKDEIKPESKKVQPVPTKTQSIKAEAKTIQKPKAVENKNVKKVIEQTEDNAESLKKMYEDTPFVEGETLRQEIHKRIIARRDLTLLVVGLPYKFKSEMTKQLVPEYVSVIIPYNYHRHQINGNAYIDVSSKELVKQYIKQLNNFKLKNRPLKVYPLTKVDENIDNYNCNRLALSNLPITVSVDALKQILTKATKIELMPMKRKDRNATRVGFAEYSSVEDAISEYDSYHGTDIDGLRLNLKFQCRSKTNIKQSISWDKKTLEVIGINKAIRMDDMKKLFPQAINIGWKVGDMKAYVTYETEEESRVDYENFMKNKPSYHMKVFYKCITHKKGEKKESKEKSEQIKQVDKENSKKKFVKKAAGEKKQMKNKPFKGNKKFDKGKLNTQESENSLKVFKSKPIEGHSRFVPNKFEEVIKNMKAIKAVDLEQKKIDNQVPSGDKVHSAIKPSKSEKKKMKKFKAKHTNEKKQKKRSLKLKKKLKRKGNKKLL